LFKRVHNLLRFTLDIGNAVKTATFQLHLHLRKRKKSAGAKPGE
jgi:hypothetical protein